MSKEKDNKKKINLKEMWKDPKGKAKIELTLYGIFFVSVIIFARVLSTVSSHIEEENKDNIISEVNEITDNYIYDIEITKNSDVFRYYGKKLGNNEVIYKEHQDIIDNYYKKSDSYYALEGEDYILINQKELYDIIDKKYFDIDRIKEYLRISTKKDNVYTVKIKQLVLENDSEEVIPITITTGENLVTIIIDYTKLVQIKDSEIKEFIVKMEYSHINKLTTLE